MLAQPALLAGLAGLLFAAPAAATTPTPPSAASTASGSAPAGSSVAGSSPAGSAPAGSSPAGSSPAGSVPAGDPFNWQPFAEAVDDRTEQGTLTVPLDYARPDGPTIELFMLRHKADPAKRIGTMLVNPGGPGFGGSFLVGGSLGLYSPSLVEAFDIIAWDPRGTGLSEPAIDCIDDDQYDRFYAEIDASADSPAEVELVRSAAKEFATGCATRNADLIQFIGTNNSARDMDAIRRALGEDTITYFGFSYGSELGATWATLFPKTVRAAVLDGAADPAASALESTIQQTKGFEATLKTFLAQCSANTQCPFGKGDAATAFDALMAKLDATPIPSVRGRPDVNRDVAIQASAEAMYSPFNWPILAQALADAEQGKGEGLLALFDEYYDRQIDGSYDNSLEAFQTISCMDQPERLSVAEEDADSMKVDAAAPRMSPQGTIGYFCTFFPAPQDPRVTITGTGAGPIVVVGTTGDPATPLESSKNMADALEDGRFVVVEADQHTGYDVNACSRGTIDEYLLDPVNRAPATGKVCPTG